VEKHIHYREAEIKDINAISMLVLRVFDKYVGSDYSQQGQDVFHSFMQPEIILKRMSTGYSFAIVTLHDAEIIGCIEVKNGNHISVLFVDDRYHRLGVAKRLISLAIEKASSTSSFNEITVNSSPYAVDIYKKLGFLQLDQEVERDGIRHIPMKKCL
jgi:GNAT superfamily N-acetyltransferase